jgi:hypothetical protein
MDNMKLKLVAASLTLLVVGAASDLSAAGVGKAVARSVTRRFAGGSVARAANGRAVVTAVGQARKPIRNVLKLDRLRDRTLPVKKLTEPRKVFRFTTNKQAQFYRHRGVASGTHFTAKAGPGRPLTAAHAKQRYGLPRMPSARVEVVLPRGTPVKSGKVIGGRPAFGEVKTYGRALSPSAVKTVIPLRR